MKVYCNVFLYFSSDVANCVIGERVYLFHQESWHSNPQKGFIIVLIHFNQISRMHYVVAQFLFL
jgi:hypothetical protein